MDNNNKWIRKMNELGTQKVPFFFAISFDQSESIVLPLDQWPHNWHIDTPLFSTEYEIQPPLEPLAFEIQAMSLEAYRVGFDKVMYHLQRGDSFLTNYTAQSRVKINWSLSQVYESVAAKYKMYIPGRFTFFSPESFISIKDGIISSFPMKGTIDASIPNAYQKILEDPKELAEHYTIVDLIRNDLSKVARQVDVPRFRYIDHIHTNDKTLLQVSSHIQGQLTYDMHRNIGTIFGELLPAGSISGAPKDKTIQIIMDAENYHRGYYTGVCGIYDGVQVDSCVMIRYIEVTNQGLMYRSGGGITHRSSATAEYQELIQKVYVPISRKHKDIQRPGVSYSMA